MKTIIYYFAIATCLLTFPGIIAQNLTEEGATSNSGYLSKTVQDSQVEQNKNEQPIIASSNTSNRSAAAELINYQAVARDAGGALMTNAAVTIEFEIRDGAGGPAVYNETQNLNTDINGVFSAKIGAVSPLVGINWANINPWLQVNLNSTNVGETQMASVPGALYSNNSGSVMIYGSGTTNADKMIAQHSPSFPNWGIGYNDVEDDIDFVSGGTKTMRVDLENGNISTMGNVEVQHTTTAPELNRVYGNSMPIAFGSVALGYNDIQTGYGITSFTNPAEGTYNIVLDHATDMNNCVVLVTPYNGSFGTPEIAGYEPTGANSFTVRIQTAGGVARDSAFTFVVYGNQ
ncbi:hypothetical protein [Aequorivita sp. KMM 9714]|uniref:hypothetical protein n=1 Tax=Aequorivita sp. KMM 9714 TaxID=2707173 RepID=UPI0013EA8D19|nr:hypothetical protein [Aequorivita sp. KMM 9714]NGX83693.1 hypothetical protein [Aequorivita sp. KMM 9714]